MSTRYYKTKTEPTKGSCRFHQPRAWIPGRKARAGLQLPLPGQLSSTKTALPHTPGDAVLWETGSRRDSQPQEKQPPCPDLDLQPTPALCSDVTQQCPSSRKISMLEELVLGLEAEPPMASPVPCPEVRTQGTLTPQSTSTTKMKIHTTGSEESLSLNGRGTPTKWLKNQTKILPKFQTLRWIHAGAQEKQDCHVSSPCLPQENPPLELGRKVKLVFRSYSSLWITPRRTHLRAIAAFSNSSQFPYGTWELLTWCLNNSKHHLHWALSNFMGNN